MHVIFYRVLQTGGVQIVRVLHERMEPLSHLSRFQPLHLGVEGPPELRPIDKLKTMHVNYAELAAKLQAIQPFLKRWVESGS